MPKIRYIFAALKDYFAERARRRRIKAGAWTLIQLQMMEADVLSYIRELEAKVRAQAHVIKVRERELLNAHLATIDAELDLQAELRGQTARILKFPESVCREVARG